MIELAVPRVKTLRRSKNDRAGRRRFYGKWMLELSPLQRWCLRVWEQLELFAGAGES